MKEYLTVFMQVLQQQLLLSVLSGKDHKKNSKKKTSTSKNKDKKWNEILFAFLTQMRTLVYKRQNCVCKETQKRRYQYGFVVINNDCCLYYHLNDKQNVSVYSCFLYACLLVYCLLFKVGQCISACCSTKRKKNTEPVKQN